MRRLSAWIGLSSLLSLTLIASVCGLVAAELSDDEKKDGFVSIFNGQDFAGWKGPVDNYEVKEGALACKASKGGTIFTAAEYSDFVVRLEFKVPAGGNNGLAIRYPGSGDTAYVGMCELQVLDDNYDKVKGALDPRQVHGSAYGMVAAKLLDYGECDFEVVEVPDGEVIAVAKEEVKERPSEIVPPSAAHSRKKRSSHVSVGS